MSHNRDDWTDSNQSTKNAKSIDQPASMNRPATDTDVPRELTRTDGASEQAMYKLK